jgi:hypothetical protein
MKLKAIPLATLLLASPACNQSPPTHRTSGQVTQREPTAPPQPPAASNAQAGEENVVTAAPEPLPEPKGMIDPRSAEAAGQVVQHLGALIEQNRLSEATKLWGNAEAASTFMKQLRPSTHIEIGEPGDMEGAAGSSYVTVPVSFYGQGFRRPAKVILRRVNDVPGSTEAQRRWHIERIDWGA